MTTAEPPGARTGFWHPRHVSTFPLWAGLTAIAAPQCGQENSKTMESHPQENRPPGSYPDAHSPLSWCLNQVPSTASFHGGPVFPIDPLQIFRHSTRLPGARTPRAMSRCSQNRPSPRVRVVRLVALIREARERGHAGSPNGALASHARAWGLSCAPARPRVQNVFRVWLANPQDPLHSTHRIETPPSGITVTDELPGPGGRLRRQTDSQSACGFSTKPRNAAGALANADFRNLA